MDKIRIQCKSTELVIDEQNRLWPCCYVNLYKKTSSWLSQQDLNWNNLDNQSFDSIIKHEGFAVHYNDEHWNNSKKCDEICKKICGVNEKEL